MSIRTGWLINVGENFVGNVVCDSTVTNMATMRSFDAVPEGINAYRLSI